MIEFDLSDQYHTLTIHSNAAELDNVIDAVNETIKIELEAQAKQAGLDLSVSRAYSKRELLERYTYKRSRIRPKWYKHTFSLKPMFAPIVR